MMQQLPLPSKTDFVFASSHPFSMCGLCKAFFLFFWFALMKYVFTSIYLLFFLAVRICKFDETMRKCMHMKIVSAAQMKMNE